MSDVLYNPRPKNWPLRFSLRSLMLLVLVLALSLGWAVHKVRQQGFAVAALKRMGCFVLSDYEERSPILERLRTLLGEAETKSVTRVDGNSSQITDAELHYLSELPQLREVVLRNTPVTDQGMLQLQGLTQLEGISLGQHVTDAGLIHLEKLTRLRSINLRGTRVTAEGARRFQKALPNCKVDWN